MRPVFCGLGIAIMLFAVAPVAVAAATPPGADILQAGIQDYRAGRPDHALAAFVLADRAAPQSALVALWMGVAAVALGDMRAGSAWFREALARPHTAAEAQVAAAWLGRLGALTTPLPTGSSTAERIAALAHASNLRLTAGQARWLGAAVVDAARSQGLDPLLLASVIYIESRFNHQSISSAGAMGLGQLMPQTAAEAGVDPRDPWQNILGAARILRWNYMEFRSWPLALAAYNAGSDAVRHYGGVPPFAETRWYTIAVLFVYQQLVNRA